MTAAAEMQRQGRGSGQSEALTQCWHERRPPWPHGRSRLPPAATGAEHLTHGRRDNEAASGGIPLQRVVRILVWNTTPAERALSLYKQTTAGITLYAQAAYRARPPIATARPTGSIPAALRTTEPL